MAYQVFITEPAANDLEEAVDYIREELKNPYAADELLQAVKETVRQLSVFPFRFKAIDIDILAQQNLRMALVKHYMIFYRVREEKQCVLILRFLYGRRDWVKILSN